jgi:hypothetical protein
MTRDWAVELLKFEGKIELWNEVTKRHAVPHIGYIQWYKFCPACGSPVDTGFTSGGTPELTLSTDLKNILSLSESQIAEQAALLAKTGQYFPETPAEQRVAVQHWLMKQYFALGSDWRRLKIPLIKCLTDSEQR